jgi:hypothetical protein
MTTAEIIRAHVVGVHSVEGAIAHRMNRAVEIRAWKLRTEGYDEMLRRHYLEGCPHPDDVNQPLDVWDQT